MLASCGGDLVQGLAQGSFGGARLVQSLVRAFGATKSVGSFTEIGAGLEGLSLDRDCLARPCDLVR